MSNRFRVLIVVNIMFTALLAGLIAYGQAKFTEPEQDNIYCEMAEIWEQSNGEYGWPPAVTKGRCDDEHTS